MFHTVAPQDKRSAIQWPRLPSPCAPSHQNDRCRILCVAVKSAPPDEYQGFLFALLPSRQNPGSNREPLFEDILPSGSYSDPEHPMHFSKLETLHCKNENRACKRLWIDRVSYLVCDPVPVSASEETKAILKIL